MERNMPIGALDSGIGKLIWEAKNAIQSLVNGKSRAVFSDVAFDKEAAGKVLGFDVKAFDPKTLQALHNRGAFDLEAGRVTLADGPLGIGGDHTTLAAANALPDNSAAAVAKRREAAFREQLKVNALPSSTPAEAEAQNARNTLPQGIVNTPAGPYDGHSTYDTGTKAGVVNLPRGVFSGGYWR
jgi:hypothetical protein